MSVFKCPVCNLSLYKDKNTYKCPNNHSYDIAKKGYVNLILANQGRSLLEGDNKEMIEARTRFLNTNAYSILRNKLKEIIFSLSNDNIKFIDVACGEGYYTNYIHQEINKSISIHTIGVDISKSAINRASSNRNILKLNNIDYVIGNLDYLPFIDNSFDILLNSFAPINEDEFNRILKEGGYYIRVLPGKYHLLGLKEFLYENVRLNEPKENNMQGFTLIKEELIEDEITINKPYIYDLFMMTPYYYKTSLEASNRLKELDSLNTKISFVIKIYKKISA